MSTGRTFSGSGGRWAPIRSSLGIRLWSGRSAGVRLRALSPRRGARAPRAPTLSTGAGWLLAGCGAALFGLCVALLFGLFAGVMAVFGTAVSVFLRRRQRNQAPRAGPLELASGYDLFAAGLRSGLLLPTTLNAVSWEFTGDARQALRAVADRLTLGADTTDAWEPALHCPDTAELGRAARRTARTGSPIANVATDLAERARSYAHDEEHARTQRVAVWISAPLGLCFLPAFLCLGILPTVLGLLHQSELT